jgi:sugar lactone lactonase YvrE
MVTTLAGSAGNYGSADGNGNGARFYGAQGIAVDASGSVIVADTMNQTIRRITPDGVVTTIAGIVRIPGSADGTSSTASFSYPGGVVTDGSGTIYVADTDGHVIRRITADGAVSTLAR